MGTPDSSPRLIFSLSLPQVSVQHPQEPWLPQEMPQACDVHWGHTLWCLPRRHPHLPDPSKRGRTGTTTPCLCISCKSGVATRVAWGFSLQKPSGERGEKVEDKGIKPHVGPNLETDPKLTLTLKLTSFACLLCAGAARSSFKELGNTSCAADVKSAVA